jgi:hypothetical protein
VNKVIHYFPNSDLRCSHRGLGKVALRAKKDPAKLTPGDFIFFINRSQTAIKILTAANGIFYVKSTRGRLNFEAVKALPTVGFGGQPFEYSDALAIVLAKNLAKVVR